MSAQATLFPPEADGVAPGFRLQRLEVYNWGTFDQHVWHVAPQGSSALVTGDIGSGKSTLVDAVTTLLVPPQKLAYNKASGAETKERNLRSYVLGFHKSERTASGAATKPVALRDERQYSVLCAVFYNGLLNETVSLVQVFWMKPGEVRPVRLYAVASRALSVTDDFNDFSTDLRSAKKRLRAEGVRFFDSFTTYCAAFRRDLGIAQESALTLFHQTVSMKAVGNLTHFVRTHMLEPFSVEGRIDALVAHFEDLRRAHRAVVEARQKVTALEPLVSDGERFAKLASERARAQVATRHQWLFRRTPRRTAAHDRLVDRGRGRQARTRRIRAHRGYECTTKRERPSAPRHPRCGRRPPDTFAARD